MKCPTCHKQWSPAYRYCPLDGTALVPAEPQKKRPRRLILLLSCAISLLTALLLSLNLYPAAIRFMADHYHISLVGIRFNDSNPTQEIPTERPLSLIFNLKNRNPIPITLHDCRFTFLINDQSVAMGQSFTTRPLKLAPGKSRSLEMSLDLSTPELLAQGKDLLLNPQSRRYQIKGALVIGHWFGQFQIPFQDEKKQLPFLKASSPLQGSGQAI